MKLTKLIFVFFLCMNSAMAVEELVLNTESPFNPTHQNRFSFLVGVNPSITKARDVTNFLFSYGNKMNDFWFDSNFQITSGVFQKLTTNNPTATGLGDVQLLDSKSTLTTIGMGVGRESRYVQTLLPFNDIFEMMAANITYNIYKESTSGKSFSGPGLLAKFSVYKRFSEYLSFGTQFNYNLAVVKRAQDVDSETSSARSLTMSYLTVGFDLSFYL
ncbi:MAG: hypothetical protein ACXVCE_08945 [Bacteriovorax sp.]